MSHPNLQGIAQTVLHQAQKQGFVVPRDIRAALAAGQLKEGLWKEVLALLGPALSCRNGRYHFVPPRTARMRARAQQGLQQVQSIRRSVRKLIRVYRQIAIPVERRGQARIELVRPVQVLTEDQRKLNLLTRDLSATGIRLLGTHRLQGQKVRLWIPPPAEGRWAWCFLVQMLWSAPVADGLYENGGMLLELLAEPADSES